MSGDSNGRRSEGRGRGRDPHRDRTRSRSRSRSPLSPVSRRGSAPERREAPERPSLEEAEPSDSGDELVDPASLEAETDHGLCRQIRHQYRALINSVQQNREDILNASDKLTEVLEEANTLFNGVSRAREAVLDAHFLVLASDLGKEKAKQLRSDLNSFDMLRYVETLLKRMEESHQEATEKEVERILGLLQTYFREDPDTPMSFFDFVVDPHSFPRTVENIFHVSFIIRDGFARIRLDQDRLPIIEPVNINEENEGIDQNTQIRNQGIIALSYRDWEEIVKTFEISEPVIPSGQSQQRLSADAS
ncbi:non-structural maintenance of chromosomes element 4 homolog A isoform X2 [Diceros bicornis minor]|uniref:non-structural maintenance of chromosomes element 4 homolog A isoform X2 n=1 Tax=Diceros bicornis minor TaxID=77932 RepID=UPI0026F0BBB4|nr:non-structural maintenance of chromosomes element 4 homolog A isoform X2 [Diceros bicornis minor]